jgi:hypothetical protein
MNVGCVESRIFANKKVATKGHGRKRECRETRDWGIIKRREKAGR